MTAASPDATGSLSETDVVLVTGSTGGIGRETARNAAAAGATVLVHGRDREKGERAVSSLPGEGHAFYAADFSELDAVRDLASRVRENHDRLDVLVNNAGTWQAERRLVPVPGGDDLELTFVVNHLAPFLLTHLLADRLVETGESRNEGDDGDDENSGASDADNDGDTDGSADEDDSATDPARVVTVSSEVHRRGTMDLDAVQGSEGPSGIGTYGLSKLANVMFTYELARRLPDEVTANCCHPGVSPATDLHREGSFLAGIGWRVYGLVGKVVDVTDSPADAARAPTYLAGSPDVADVNGAYFDEREQTRSSEASYDRNAQRELWQRSAEWVDLSENERERLST